MQAAFPVIATATSQLAPLVYSRQGADAFNQPLTFDTSKVTTMWYMFAVRALAPTSSREPFPAMPLAPSPPPTALSPPSTHLPLASYAHLATRQNAEAFNQPLSLDTSSVTTMQSMFAVRSVPLPAQPPQLGYSLRTLLAPPPPPHTPLPSPGPACRPSSHASLSTRQGAEAFNQPLSWDTSSVTTMKWMFGVRPPRACPLPAILRSWPPPQLAHALPPPGLHVAPLPMFPFGLGRVRRR